VAGASAAQPPSADARATRSLTHIVNRTPADSRSPATEVVAGLHCRFRARAARPSPQEDAHHCYGGRCPSWARARTLRIQGGHCNSPNSGNLQAFTRDRVTRCRGLTAFVSDFAVLYSLKVSEFAGILPQDPFRAARLARRAPAVDECFRLASNCVTRNLFTIILLA